MFVQQVFTVVDQVAVSIAKRRVSPIKGAELTAVTIDLSEILTYEKKMVKRLIECLPFFQKYIVFDYIQKYPSRTKQILGISYEQLQSLLNCADNRHKEIRSGPEG